MIPSQGADNKNSKTKSAQGRSSGKTLTKIAKERRLKDVDKELSKLQKAEDRKQLVDSIDMSLIDELRQKYEESKLYKEKVQRSTSLSNVILFQAHPGPQTDFLASIEYEVAFVGGRNSGKSTCLLVDPLRFVYNPNFKGLLIRKTMAALREIIGRAKSLYPKMYPGTKWKEQEKIFEFPSGAIIEFGYFDHIDDYDRYHGREFAWVGIDEISQYHSQEYYDKIKSVVRSTDPRLIPRIRVTSNPSGPGRPWLKEYFDIESGVKSKVTTTTVEVFGKILSSSRKYIQSTILDNPTALENDPQYLVYLQSLPETQRRQWLEGDFDANEGLAFEEFSRHTHVIAPFAIPSNWIKIRCIDWGFKSKAVCLWIAFDYDQNAYIYREYVTGGGQVHADEFAKNVLTLEANEYISYGVVDGGIGSQSGTTGPTVEEDFLREGLANQHADKTKDSRIHGKQLIHKYLRVDKDTGQARLKIFEGCKQIIKEFGSLMVSPNNSEDVNTRMDDHAYDALRYGLSSRPEPLIGNTNQGRSRLNIIDNSSFIVNSTFGY